jgi:hypothetical protein
MSKRYKRRPSKQPRRTEERSAWVDTAVQALVRSLLDLLLWWVDRGFRL